MFNAKQSCFIFILRSPNVDLYLVVYSTKRLFYKRHTHIHTQKYIHLANPIDETSGPTALANKAHTRLDKFTKNFEYFRMPPLQPCARVRAFVILACQQVRLGFLNVRSGKCATFISYSDTVCTCTVKRRSAHSALI
jgi:hypothetical protein